MARPKNKQGNQPTPEQIREARARRTGNMRNAPDEKSDEIRVPKRDPVLIRHIAPNSDNEKFNDRYKNLNIAEGSVEEVHSVLAQKLVDKGVAEIVDESDDEYWRFYELNPPEEKDPEVTE